MFTKHKPHTGCQRHPRQRRMVTSASAWRCLQWPCYIQCVVQQNEPFRCCRGWWECTAHFLSYGEIDIQSRPSEGTNTSSLCIWHKPFSGFWDIWFKKTKKTKVEAKDVLPNINRTQATAVASRPGSDGMAPSAAAWRYFQRARYNAVSMGRNLSLVTLTFKLVQARD